MWVVRTVYWVLLGSQVMVAVACRQGGVRIRTGDVPEPDGVHIIGYRADVLEDDTDCDARVPYKRSCESMVVEWHTDRDVTVYTRGGLFVTDVELRDDGSYGYDGTAGVCGPGSWADGWLTRERGAGKLVCVKRECTVVITTDAVAHPPDAGPACPVDGGAG